MENNSFKDMPEAVREAVLVSGTATFLSLVILKYQDQILELCSQVTQQTKDALGDTFRKILDFLGDYEFFYPEIGISTIADRMKNLVPNFGNTEPESGE